MPELKVSNYRVLYDGMDRGYRASAGTVDLHDGVLSLVFIFASDGKRGEPQHIVRSTNMGKTWSDPVLFGPPLTKPEEQHQSVMLAGRTRAGTLIATGFHIAKGIREDGDESNYYADVAWRPSEAIFGRQPAGTSEMTFVKKPTGTFMGEQFAHFGRLLKSRRIVHSIWGAKNKGENWRSGVLLSDDDGVTYRYRDVAYEPDLAIRAKPEMPAGFNEVTLFECNDGRLVAIIRGREKLGATDKTLHETYFFCCESRDGGETWSRYEQTNLAGTGATLAGLTLPDGSLLQAARVPHPFEGSWVKPADPKLYGLHLSRSRDDGRTWRTQQIIQHEPGGRGFDDYYNCMNGQFITLAPDRWMYCFGHFEHAANRHRILSLELHWS